MKKSLFMLMVCALINIHIANISKLIVVYHIIHRKNALAPPHSGSAGDCAVLSPPSDAPFIDLTCAIKMQHKSLSHKFHTTPKRNIK